MKALAFFLLALAGWLPAQVDQQRRHAEIERSALRERLRQQFGQIFETKETPHGLIVTFNDGIFEPGRATFKAASRVKLAKVAGLLLAYAGLKVRLESYWDNSGNEAANRKISEERAGAIRDYLESQGFPAADMTAAGLGANNPVASNDSPAGREQNRRVEMVVYGDPLGMDGTGPKP